MLEKLHIGNFKAFGDNQNIPIRPITLIYGANSSGKSSIIHSLLLANHALFSNSTSPLDVHKTRLSDSVDLGGFRQYVHQHDIGSDFSFGVDVSLQDLPEPTRDFFDSFKRISLRYKVAYPGRASFHFPASMDDVLASPTVCLFELLLDNSIFVSIYPVSASLRHNTFLDISRSHQFYVTLIDRILEAAVLPNTLTPDEFSLTSAHIGDRLLELDVPYNFEQLGVELRSDGLRFHVDRSELSFSEFGQPWSLQEVIASRDREAILKAAVDFYLPTFLAELANHVNGIMEKTFLDVSYLGPLRTYPPRHLISGIIEHNSDREKLEAWEVLAANPSITSQVNVWLSSERLQTPYELVVREWLDSESLRTYLDEYWQKALKAHSARLEERETDDPVTIYELCKFDLEDKIAELDVKNSNLYYELDRLLAIDFTEDEQYRQQEVADAYGQAEVEIEVIESQIANLEKELEGLKTKSEWELFAATFSTLSISRLRDLRLIDRNRGIEVSHRDIGVGISQVLPVLVEALTLKGILAIEQPELHLHPALQAELGDLFIQSALKHKLSSDNPDSNTNPPGNLILETHSEHILLRIMRRMRDTYNRTLPEDIPPVTPDDVALLFVEPGRDGTGSVVRHLQLSEDGVLLDPWPGGFFEEGYTERFS